MEQPKIQTINHISQIVDIVDTLHGTIIIAFDWDNCISLVDGCNLPLRDPLDPDDPRENGNGERVLETFDALNQRRIKYFVITSRLKGLNIELIMGKTNLFGARTPYPYRRVRALECIKEHAMAFHEALPFLSKDIHNNPIQGLNPPDPVIKEHRRDGLRYAYSIIFENIIFAGSSSKTHRSNKGYALVHYMANGILPTADQFDHFIFVDNEMRHINNVISAFEEAGFQDKLIPIYYPQDPMFNVIANKELCTSMHDIDACFGQKINNK